MQPNSQSQSQFEQEVRSRLGVLPNFFRSAPDAPELTQQLWIFAKAAYLDNPLPSLFKERLFVHLSRFCSARYCIIRHVGFLLGYGHPSGDTKVKTQSIRDVIALLRYPAPSTNEVQSAMAHLVALPAPLDQPPQAGDKNEFALFHAVSAIFLNSTASESARNALRHAVGERRCELILGFIAFVRTAHFWTVLHPEISIEDDMEKLLAQQQELAALVMNCGVSEKTETGLRLDSELQPLHREQRHGAELTAAKKSLEELNLQKNNFIAMLGHELRNPVAAITAVSEMFQMVNTADVRLRNASNILHRQTQALARMLDDLLDVSTLAFGKVSITNSRLAVDDVLTSVVREFEQRFKAKGLTLKMEAPAKPAYILGDRTRLAQVFENILCNALQFTEAPGHVAVNTRVDRKHVTISFMDSGAGFEPEFIKTMFEPFAQAPQDLGRRQGGLGLGLAIAKAIAELHEGSLEATSPGSGKGATFRLSLPLNARAQDAKDAGNDAPRTSLRTRVLVIEDNRDFSQLFRDMLQIMGCDPNAASTARSGLEIAKKTMPDIIFCDIGLPGDMNGFDFACAVRADEELAHIPLIAVSGYTRDHDKERAANAGFDRVFPKPVKFADINEALETFSKGNRSGG